ncbi:hypothetical protein CQ059_16765 [Brucella pseudogrignonensis]|nr:hypothetical protein CQ059_16765 [Brucella pseudogrignonensis]PRA40378.1 hypothetical protein CQ063_12390 [Brucella pseudogrignonensis]PRA68971.1 hypothetical protein CQ055_12275 [Brucella pseudogrignonensis]
MASELSRTESELLSERVPLAAAKSWLDPVDDWSFANRIRSRSEAIRRLVEIGLTTGDNSK